MKKYYDVIIIGGGTGGVCAAAAFLNSDYKVAIIEQNSSLGGTTTEGFVSTWAEGVNLDFHIQMFNALSKTGNTEGNLENSWLPIRFTSGPKSCIIKFNPLKVAEYYGELFDNAPNIDVYYNSVFEDIKEMNQNSVSEISISNKDGMVDLVAKYFIDASGDGALCRKSAKYTSSSDVLYYIGRDSKEQFNESLAMDHNDTTQLNEPSLFFELINSDVNCEEYKKITNVYAAYSEENGEIIIDDDVFLDDNLFEHQNYNLDKIKIVRPNYIVKDGYRYSLNIDGREMFFCNPMCGAGISGYEIMRYSKAEQYSILKKRTLEYWKYIKYSLVLANRNGEKGYWDKSGWLVSDYGLNIGKRFANICGIRESYRIKCRYMLNQNDLVKDIRMCKNVVESHFIAIGNHNVDMHNQFGLTGIDEFNQNQLKPYGIKYDCLIPISLSNVLICCKAFGASQIAISSARIVKTISQIGWAGGQAIRLCLDRNLNDTSLDDSLISILQSERYTNFVKYYSIIKEK